ncbi:CocE/NonD family hydrolase [Acinetobacter sp. 194]|uniref:CocE/NonD family hydrolase n=1 Tax=Acinetobacter shaoyimingii TaxID=2715164 RepID=UPI001408F4B1|nr:CocE/NonD family hydrolase [Acinetobacter shaoyimingii]NHB58263.1 CocE/NonD family hydrolase [Acinetobacter shaoyimingii]
MKLLNTLYAAIGISVAVIGTTVGIVNKSITPTQNITSDLNYLSPQSNTPNATTLDPNQIGHPNITLKNTRLGTRANVSKAQYPVTTNADAKWQLYDRAEDYPKIKALPTQWINMKDGTRIAVYVTLPADEQGNAVNTQFPVILIQTAYNGGTIGRISSIVGGADPDMVKRGYATVVVDVRGTGNSAGKWEAFGNTEQQDAFEIIDWTSKQSWSNGKIGLYGVSYLGITTLLGAATQHPAVKAAFPIVPIGDSYRDILFNGGQLNTNFIPAWLGIITVLGTLPIDAYLADPVKGQALAYEKLKNTTEFQIPLVFDALGGTDFAFDYDFWGERSPLEYADKIKVPTFIVGGTRDLFQRSEPLWLEALKDQTTAKIFVGPWNHIQAAQLFPSLPKDNIPKLEKIALQWFDQYLKGMDVGADRLPNVTQWVHGYENYVTTTDWPHVELTPDRFFLNNKHTLVRDKTTDKSGESFLIQAPTFGLCSSTVEQVTMGISSLVPFPCLENSNLSNIPAAVFNTEPLTEDYYLNGPMQADLWVSTSSKDTGIVVRISDVDPKTGNAKTLSTGILTASLRKVDESRSRYIQGQMIQPWQTFKKEDVQPLEKNQPVLMQIEIPPTAVLIPKGHKIQVSVVASDIWKGVAPLPTLKSTLLGSISIYSNASYPSSVVLPKVPTQYVKN